ncbi:co-chaperone GroES [Eubacterium minutum ATCC 700079]|nr:co-chaperone GroES [Eubacterium minutum ATCC 700079]
MSFGIKPLGNRVALKKLEAEEKTSGGIILTSSAKEAPQVAEVVAAGPGSKDEPMELKVGDKVVFSKYAGTDIKFEGEEYTIMSQDDILAIVE